MKGLSPKIILALSTLSVLVMVLASGCASMRASSARSAYIHRMTEQHVYNTPCQQVWPTARQLLFTRGYSVKDTGEGSVMTLETEWQYNSAGNSASRYLVQGIQPAEGQCQVNFSINTRSGANGNANANRDLEIEWNLLQQVDPNAAAAISQDAEVQASAAAAQS